MVLLGNQTYKQRRIAMTKKVLMVSSVFFMLFTVAAFAAVENVKVSGDATVYGVERSNFNLGSGISSPFHPTDPAAKNVSEIASVFNLRFNADLTQDIAATITMTDERIWGRGADDIYASEAYITFKKFFNSPLSIKIGLLPVRLGDGILLGDFNGPTNQFSTGAFHTGLIDDLSQRKNPEGIVAEYDFSEWVPLKLTSGYIKVNEGSVAERDDINVYFANLGYIYKNMPVAEIFYVGKKAQHKTTDATVALNAGDSLDSSKGVDNVGARLIISPVKDLAFLFNAIFQHPNRGDATPDTRLKTAWLASMAAQYSFTKLPWSPVVSVDFGIATDRWNTMYEDVSCGSILNAIISDTNGIVAGATISARPTTDLGVKVRYVNARLYKANTPIYNNYATYALTSNREIGNELDVSATYDYTEDVQFGVEGGVFLPGHAFDESNRRTASQAIGKVKVSF
jgi:hypothetical protein